VDGPARFPWQAYQEVCLGVLQWPPDAFWRATTWDVLRAWEGYAKSKGISLNGNSTLTADDVTELKRMIEEDDNARRAGSPDQG
jgi:hypothetical protein